MEDYVKTIKIRPAYDKTNDNKGVHGADLIMLLKGKEGAVQFVLFTNWGLPDVTERLLNKPITSRIDLECRFLPMPADVGYHSPKPMYDGQKPISNCTALDGKPCYYEGSTLYAEKVFDILVSGGSDAVWNELENYYNSVFHKEKE